MKAKTIRAWALLKGDRILLPSVSSSITGARSHVWQWKDEKWRDFVKKGFRVRKIEIKVLGD
ncbi:MAG: hypothetical protein PHC68_02595 [Syntrophorhabdaceae bacterium]|nr:hypothetical protein [Syntrophorhabdaceae bacterium]